MLDKIDKKIIEILSKDGRMSLTKLGETLGLSHVAVRKRLEKLLSKNVMKVLSAMNLHKLGLKIVVLLAEVRSSRDVEEIVKKYSSCPRMLFLSTIMGRYNLMAMMIGENDQTLESILTVCSFRRERGIMKSEVHLVSSIPIPRFMPMKIVAEKKGTTTPCGMDCSNCKRYLQGLCLACPATEVYKGSF